MIVLGFLLGLIIILQIFVLVGICRTNYKLNELSSTTASNVFAIGLIDENMKRITNILNQLVDIVTGTPSKKKHKKKKGVKFYADNEPES